MIRGWRRLAPLLCLAWLLAASATAAQAPGPDFTEAERQYLARHPVLRVGVSAGQNPFQDIVRGPDGSMTKSGSSCSSMTGPVSTPPEVGIPTQPVSARQTTNPRMSALRIEHPQRRRLLRWR